MKPVVIHSQAGSELDEAIAFYELHKTGLGLDLHAAVEEAVENIQQNPRLGAPYKETEFRRHVLRRFPFVIFYAELDDVIWIIAVAHAKRRPDYWKRRRVQ